VLDIRTEGAEADVAGICNSEEVVVTTTTADYILMSEQVSPESAAMNMAPATNRGHHDEDRTDDSRQLHVLQPVPLLHGDSSITSHGPDDDRPEPGSLIISRCPVQDLDPNSGQCVHSSSSNNTSNGGSPETVEGVTINKKEYKYDLVDFGLLFYLFTTVTGVAGL